MLLFGNEFPGCCRIEAQPFVEWVCGGRPAAGNEPDLEEKTMTEYLITFNDEWVPDHTADEVREKAKAVREVVDEMLAEGVLIFTNGGLDRSTAVCSVEAVDGKPVFTDGPYIETKEHLGGFAVVDVPDDEAARYWAGRLATVLDWPQEVHRFRSAGQARRNGSRDT
jgi:hypothetical protein